MKIKTSELTRSALDWAVAEAQGLTNDNGVWFIGQAAFIHDDDGRPVHYSPSTNWAQGGPIIEREKMDFKWVCNGRCRASVDWLDEKFSEAFGPTPLIAAMHCYVASELGDEVEVPDELF